MKRRTTYTFDFFTWRPRFRSYSFTPRPVNWYLFKWYDWLPLAVGMILASVLSPNTPFMSAVAWVLAGFYVVAFPFMVLRRLRARARYCETQGHTPYQPDPEADAWECVYCGTPLRGPRVSTVATSVARAASEVELARRKQSFYSDRR